ncbi:MAG TPA: peptidylprolyl isomerase [Vicinamibacterales bacterium]|nr:peptidylprolyl isomerase [Vicinamibacterales bacterium]
MAVRLACATIALLSALFDVDAALAVGSTEQSPSPKLVEMYVRNGVAELGVDATTAEGREKIARLERAVREELADRALIQAEARHRGLPIAPRLDARREQWIARLGGQTGYADYLAEHRLTDAEFQQVVEQEIAGELLREELTREVHISDHEVLRFYETERTNPAWQELFVEPEKVTASHILIAARQGLYADLDASRERALRIHRDLLNGADFAALARRHSDDPGTRERGGNLGPFTRDTHTEAFDRAAFALAPGQTSPVIRTEYGFHIIRVTAKSPPRLRTLDELRPAIRAGLAAQKSAYHLRAWLQQQRTQAPLTTTEKR